MGYIRTPCTKQVRCPFEIGNRVGGVKPSRGFESHPLRFILILQVKRERSGGKKRGSELARDLMHCQAYCSREVPCATGHGNLPWIIFLGHRYTSISTASEVHSASLA